MMGLQVLSLMQALVSFMASNQGTFMMTLMSSGSIESSLDVLGAPSSFVRTFTVRFVTSLQVCVSRIPDLNLPWCGNKHAQTAALNHQNFHTVASSSGIAPISEGAIRSCMHRSKNLAAYRSVAGYRTTWVKNCSCEKQNSVDNSQVFSHRRNTEWFNNQRHYGTPSTVLLSSMPKNYWHIGCRGRALAENCLE
jgi:hypothetical protein